MFGKKKKKADKHPAQDGAKASSPTSELERSHLGLITAYEESFGGKVGYLRSKDIREKEVFKTISDMSPDERAEFLVTYVRNIPFIRLAKPLEYGGYSAGNELFGLIIRRKTNFTPQHIIDIFTALGNISVATNHWQAKGKFRPLYFFKWNVGQIVNQLEKCLKTHQLTESETTALADIAELPHFKPAHNFNWGANVTKARDKLRKLIAIDDGSVPEYEFTNDGIGQNISQSVAAMPPDQISKWHALFQTTETASGSKPTKKLQSELDAEIDAIGTAKFKSAMQGWLVAAAKPNAFNDGSQEQSWNSGRLNTRTTNLLKGLVWGMARFHDEKSLSAIAGLAEKSFERLPNIGPAAPALGNACIYTLATSKGLGGVAHLSRLKLRIKQNNTQKLIQNHIETQAAKLGLKAAQIEDMAAPDFGLELGRKKYEFKDFTLRLEALSPGSAPLTWYKPDGSVQKSVPSFVKDSKPMTALLKKARALAKDIKKASTAQRDRIDRLYTEDMSWDPEEFDKYYLRHGLIGPLARKLIWMVTIDQQDQPAIFNDGKWENVKGEALTGAAENFKLWHPIMSEVNEILAWRRRLETLQICQPFKQVYREVYILTDAEVNTRVYSNRMAAHILKQHQFNTLAAIRGWKYQLMGAYDDGRENEIAYKKIPAYDLIAEFWIDELPGEAEEFNEAGIWNYIATDQVRFKNANDDTIELVDVPPIILSEILRDADLFVGVASVGNDPAWSDRGGTPRAREYWQSYSFGDLSETAKTRKSVLENLVPRLKIRDKAKIDGKFLIVQGTRHSYKIHMGSSNILIQPSDRYLCIVPGRGKDKNLQNLFLPFEGDRGLSVVLSKAFMLVEDDKIKDATILSQL